MPLDTNILSRRALIRAGSLLGVATLTPILAGCGGSSLPAEDAFPEVYSDTYVTDVRYEGDGSPYRRAVAVTTGGDVYLSERSTTYSESGVYFESGGVSEHRLVRYSDRGQPGLAVRTEVVMSRPLPESVSGAILASREGRIYVSQHFLSEPSGDGGVGNELAVFDSGGAPSGTIRLDTPADFDRYRYSALPLGNLLVSPAGEFFCAADVPTPYGPGYGGAVWRWDRTGAFIKTYVAVGTRQFLGYDIAFDADGAPVMLGYDEYQKTSGILRLDDESGAGFVPMGTRESGLNRLQTDAAGNFYFSSRQPGGRAAKGRNQPSPTPEYIRKFSPTGRELAYIRLGEYPHYSVPSVVVDAEGTIYTAFYNEMRVFRRTR